MVKKVPDKIFAELENREDCLQGGESTGRIGAIWEPKMAPFQSVHKGKNYLHNGMLT